MNRAQWAFSYPADKLLEAAQAKLLFHGERLVWWDKKAAECNGEESMASEKVIDKRTGAIRFVMLEANDTRDTSIHRPNVYFAKSPDAPRSEWAVFAAWAFHQRYAPVAVA